MIMGHKSCGGIKALMSRSDTKKFNNEFIDKCVRLSAPALRRRPSDDSVGSLLKSSAA